MWHVQPFVLLVDMQLLETSMRAAIRLDFDLVREQTIDPATPVARFATLDEFLESTEIPAGLLSIQHNGLFLDVLNSPAISDTTIVCFHGAALRDVKLPWHVGRGVTGSTGANRVFVCDPTLYMSEELHLSWYAGSTRIPDLQDILARIVRHIVGTTGGHNLVFFGSSGGGFASLEMSRRFSGSLALAMNPQTSISKFYAGPVQRYAQIAWGRDSLSDGEFPMNHDVVGLYADGFSNHVAMIQNARDWFHIGNHQLPFLDVVGLSPNVYMLMDRWGPSAGDGHTPAPKEILAPILAGLASCNGAWSEALPGLGFQLATTDSDVRARVSATAENNK